MKRLAHALFLMVNLLAIITYAAEASGMQFRPLVVVDAATGISYQYNFHSEFMPVDASHPEYLYLNRDSRLQAVMSTEQGSLADCSKDGLGNTECLNRMLTPYLVRLAITGNVQPFDVAFVINNDVLHLSDSQYQQITHDVQDWFTNYPQLRLLKVSKLSADDHAFYDWLAVNYTEGHLTDVSGITNTVPVIEHDFDSDTVHLAQQLPLPVDGSVTSPTAKTVHINGQQIAIDTRGYPQWHLLGTTFEHALISPACLVPKEQQLNQANDDAVDCSQVEAACLPIGYSASSVIGQGDMVGCISKLIDHFDISDVRPIDQDGVAATGGNAWKVLGDISYVGVLNPSLFRKPEFSLATFKQATQNTICGDWQVLNDKWIDQEPSIVAGACALSAAYLGALEQVLGFSEDATFRVSGGDLSQQPIDFEANHAWLYGLAVAHFASPAARQ